jgi:hypothetical protein
VGFIFSNKDEIMKDLMSLSVKVTSLGKIDVIVTVDKNFQNKKRLELLCILVANKVKAYCKCEKENLSSEENKTLIDRKFSTMRINDN